MASPRANTLEDCNKMKAKRHNMNKKDNYDEYSRH